MKLSRKAGTTSQTLYLFLQDASKTDGSGLTGLVYNSTSLVAYYVRARGSATAITLATQTVTGAFSSGGFVEVSSANMPGIYRLDLPDAALASGVDNVVIMLKGAANLAPVVFEMELTAWDNQDAVRGGMTALPNANAEAAGGLFTRGTGAGQVNQNANGQLDTRWVAGNVTVDANNDKAGYGLSSGERTTLAGVVWAILTSTLTTVGSIGKLLVDDIDAAISSRSSYGGADTSGTTTLLSRLTSTRATNLDHLDADISTRLASSAYTAPDNTDIAALAGRLTSGRAANLDNLDAAVSTRAQPGDAMALTSVYDLAKTAAQAGDAMALTSGERSTLADVVWASTSRTLTSFGGLVSAIWGSVVDSPGVTTLLARLTSGRATGLDHLDADISTRLAASSYTAPDNTDIAAIKAKTDLIPAAGPPDAAYYTNARGALLAHLDDDISTRLSSAEFEATTWVTPTDVKAQVVEALASDTYPETPQEMPLATSSLAYKLSWLYKLARNRMTQTNSVTSLYNASGTVVDQVSAVYDDGTVFNRDGFQSGP
jgi:hypothetical protein